MHNDKSFYLLLVHARMMMVSGQDYQRERAMENARMQYNGALTLLNWLADGKPRDRQRLDEVLEQVHGLLASFCYQKSEFEQAAIHVEEQLALHAKSFGVRASDLVDIYVSLSKTYRACQNKVAEARAAAETACEIASENGSHVRASAIYANYHLCLCERDAGNKTAAAAALKRALAMLDASPLIIKPVEADVIRALASEFA